MGQKQDRRQACIAVTRGEEPQCRRGKKVDNLNLKKLRTKSSSDLRFNDIQRLH